MKRLFAALAIASTLAARSVSADPPTITYTAPLAAVPGQTTEVSLFGTNLIDPTGVWSNLPIAAELAPGDKNGKTPTRVAYRLTLPPDAPVGIGGLRIATPGGVSALRLFMIDDLPSVAEAGNNKTPATAQELPFPSAVDAASEAESYDYFKFNATAGQRISVEVVARRLGSALDPVVRLLDANGNELAYGDDDPSLGADCRFAHRLTAAGTYFLEVRDIRYQGNANYRYRLRLGDFPLRNSLPAGAAKGSNPELTIAGTAVEGVVPMTVAVPLDAGDRLALGVKYPQGLGSASVSLVVGKSAEQIEFEPNDTPETASPLTLPGAVSGRFLAAKDRDYYSFTAKKGDHLLLTGRTRSLGSPTDLFLRLFAVDGKQLAEVEDTGAEEGTIDFTAPADGVYRLMVEDLLRRGGPEHAYRIEVEPYSPGFGLVLEAEKFDAPKGGVISTKVTVVRRGYTGPITLALVGAPDDFQLARNVIAEGKADTLLGITVPARHEPGAFFPLTIVGRATIDKVAVEVKATTLPVLQKQFGNLTNPPAALDGSLAIGVGPVFADFFKLKVVPEAVPYPQLIGTQSFQVKVEKLNKFDDKIELAITDLPSGFTAKVAAIDKGKAEATIELTGPATLAEGEYRFRLTGSATFQNQPKTVEVANVALRVVQPCEVALVPAGPLALGGKQKLAVKVTRYGGEKGALKVTLAGLPKGVSAPAEIQVAEGQAQAEVELSAAADAAVGAVELVATATTKIKDRTVTVTSAPAPLEIKKP